MAKTQSQKASSKKKKKSQGSGRGRLSAVTIWIIIEAVVVFGVLVAGILHKVYAGESPDEPSFVVPDEVGSDVSIDDIVLPTDLMGGELDDEEAYGSLYSMDYSDDILVKISEMSVDRKINSLLVITPEALCHKTTVIVAGDIFKDSYETNPVTGFFFRDSNFASEREGMEMLKAIRGWSRDITGMNIFLGYWGNTTDAETLSKKGINLYTFSPDAENASELMEAASANKMVPAYFDDLSAIMNMEELSGFYIARSDDVTAITDAINSGKKLLYMTDDYETVRDGLLKAVEEGTIPIEAIDSATGYALTARQSLTDIRPEDYEAEPPAEEPKPEASAKPKTTTTPAKKKTPEEEAADALKALQKQMEEAAAAAASQQQAAPATPTPAPAPAEQTPAPPSDD